LNKIVQNDQSLKLL